MANPDLKTMPLLIGSSDAAASGTIQAYKRIPVIPPKIYRIIVGNLWREDIKRARLTCKELHQGLTPFLFDTIYLTTEYDDIEHTRRILQHFRSCITTVVLSPVNDYTCLRKAEYQALVRCCFERFQVRAQWQQLHDLSYETYCEELPDKSRMLSDREPQELFEECLAMVPNTRKVILCDKRRLQCVADTLLRKYWPVDYEACDNMQHAFRMFDRILHAKSCREGTRSWTTVVNTFFKILPEANSDIRELAIMSDYNRHFMEPSSLDLLIQADRRHTNLLANMTRLRFAFARYPNIEDGVLENTIVAKALGQAHNLECLLLEFQMDLRYFGRADITTFQAVLGDCYLPKLKEFGFADGDATEGELISFFVKHSKIRTLVLAGIRLCAGVWKNVVQTIKEKNSLHFVRLFDPAGGFEDIECPFLRPWRGYFGDYNTLFRAVEAFFHNDGPNPFSGERIARWYRDNEPDKVYCLGEEQGLYRAEFNDIFGLHGSMHYTWQPYEPGSFPT